MRKWRSLPSLLFGCGSAALLSCCSGYSNLAAPVAASPLRAGPMLCDLTATSVRIWAEATAPVQYRLQVRVADEDGIWQDAMEGSARSLLALNGPGFRGVARITGLRPASRYAYRLVDFRGRWLPDVHGQFFQTAPVDGTAKDFTVAFGSCAGESGLDPSQPIFAAIDALQPDLFLWLGDNTYFTAPHREWEQPELMEQRWSSARAISSLQPLLAHTPQYATWDDHDYGSNDSDSTFPLRAESKRLFEEYWPNPAAGLSSTDGIFFQFTWGRVEFFFLDTRYGRSPNDAVDGPQKVLLSAGQWQWLEQGLQNSHADFKVVVSSTQVLSTYHRFETWNMFPQQRARLLDLIQQKKVSGVFFLSGDRHIGEALRELRPGSYPLVEFTSSPLAAKLGEAQPDAAVPQRIAHTLATVENFGMLHFHFPAPGAADFSTGPVLSFRLHDVYGHPLGSQVVLRLSALQP
jgi:alkaline phosphatase D